MAAVAATNGNELPPIRTKIVATIGPASRTPAVLRRLIEAGVNVFRLNFSHGTHEEHSAVLADIRAVSREAGRHVGVLQDLCGPKMRLGPIPGDLVECPLGEEFTLVADRSSDSPRGTDLLVPRAAERPQARRDGPVRRRHRGDDRDRHRAGPGAAEGDAPRAAAVAAGAEPARLGVGRQVADRQGPARPRLDRTARRRRAVRRAVVRPQRRRTSPGCAANCRRGSARRGSWSRSRSRRRCGTWRRSSPRPTGVMVARGDLGVEMDVQRVPAIQKRVIASVQPGPPPGHHRHADAQQHGALEPADPGRGERRVQRRPRRHRRRHAVGGDRGRRVPGRGGRHHAADLRRGRGVP